jgi:hypothetical protein
MEFLPVLELIDRLCIARVKHARTQGANQVERDWYEHKLAQLPQSAELDEAIQAMTDIHHAIWDLEWQLKSGVEQMLSLQEIGRRAIAIRDFNNKRIAYKNSVANILGHPVTEIKQDHLADGTVDTK